MKELEPKQRRFVEEYLFDLNQTNAAIRAGYSARSAASRASKLMKQKEVAEAIQAAMAQRSRRTGISQDRIIEELAKVAFVNPADLMDLNTAKVKDGFSPDDAAAVSNVRYKRSSSEAGSSVERNIDMHNKIKALELLGKHLGMFTDKVQVEQDTAFNIQIAGDFDEC